MPPAAGCPPFHKVKRTVPVLLIPVLLLAIFLTQARAAAAGAAATISVNTTVDEISDNGRCSLREAIETANTGSGVGGCSISGSGPYQIDIPSGIYFLSLGTYDEDGNQGGDFDLRASVTLQGAGAGSTRLDANTLDRVFDIDPTDAVTIEVTIADLTIQNGQPISRTGGGGIRNFDDSLTILRSVISDNRLTGAYVANDFKTASGGGILSGGGPFSGAGTLSVIDSVIEDNSTTYGSGGGICNDGGSLNISGSIIRGNLANVIQGASSAGGVMNSGGTANIIGSAILDNEADGHTGGLGNFFSAAVMNVANSTISGNRTDGSGGGIRNSGEMRLTNVTISDNIADLDAAFGGMGGGIRNNTGATIYMKGVILYGNTDVDSPDSEDDVFPDIKDTGTLISQGYNLLGVISGTTGITAGVNGDLVGVNPGLGALTGSPPYYPLPPLSPALDQIPAEACTFLSGGANPLFADGALNLFDQSGSQRPNPATQRCDIGAHEPPYQYVYIPALLVFSE